MNEHVNAWIPAYHDGELSGDLRRKVEAHLKTCAACLEELEALQSLSKRLKMAPAPAPRLSPERFLSQVRLKMGEQAAVSSVQRRLRLGWWLAPAGIMGLWAFGQAVLVVSGWLFTLLPALDRSMSLRPILRAGALWQPDQGLALILVLELGLTFLTAVLLGGWLASWWATKS